MLEHGRRIVDDRLRLRIEADRQHRHLGVAATQGAVTAAPAWWRPPRSANSYPGAAETISSPAFGFWRAAQARSTPSGYSRQPRHRVPRAEAQLLAVAPGHGLVAFEEEHRLHGLFGVESHGELARSELALGQPVDHPGPVRRGDERSVKAVEARLQPHVPSTCVWP